MHGRIRRKRLYTGLRKAVGEKRIHRRNSDYGIGRGHSGLLSSKAVGKKRVHRRNGDHGIGRGHSGPHPSNKAVGKKRIYGRDSIQRIGPRSSFFSRNSRYGFCSGTRTGTRNVGRGFYGSGRNLRSCGPRL